MNFPPLAFLLVLVVVALVIYFGIKAAQARAERERIRQAELAAWAGLNGFTYSAADAWDLPSRYNGLMEIGRGHDRYAYEVLARGDPVQSFIFRYHFRTTETRTVHYTDAQGHMQSRVETYEQDHWQQYLIVELPAALPSLVLRPEHWADKVAALVGFDDIDFESEAFSKQYFCKSADRQFAYAVIHPQMMEWLMTQQFSAQIEGRAFMMDLSHWPYTAAACYGAWAQAAAFINRVPPFVWQDYAQTQPLQLPDLMPPQVAEPLPAG